MAPKDDNNQETAITLNAGQIVRGFVFGIAIIGGYPVYDNITTRGILGKTHCPECEELVLRLEKLESRAIDNDHFHGELKYTRWTFKDQQKWSDLLQELNPNINVPNPRNGN